MSKRQKIRHGNDDDEDQDEVSMSSLYVFEPHRWMFIMFRDNKFMDHLDDLLGLLHEFPTLAKEKYPCPPFRNTFWYIYPRSIWAYPLYSLIMARANLDTVRFVYELYPSALEEVVSDEFQTWPLHDACRLGSISDDVLQFMIRKFPQAASKRTRCDPTWFEASFPVELLLDEYSKPSVQTVQMLLEAYPEVILEKDPESYREPFAQYSLLSSAMAREHHSAEIVELIATKMAQTRRVHSLSLVDCNKRNCTSLPPTYANAVSPLWASLRNVQFVMEQDNGKSARVGYLEGFRIMLEKLGCSHVLETLEIVAQPFPRNGDSEGYWCDSLVPLLNQATSLQKLVLKGERKSFGCHETVLKALQLAPSLPLTLQDIHIEGCQIGGDILASFLQQPTHRLPCHLHLHDLFVPGRYEWKDDDASMQSTDRNNTAAGGAKRQGIKTLVMTSLACSRNWMRGFLSFVQKTMHGLESLEIRPDYKTYYESCFLQDDQKPVNATPAVLSLLDDGVIKAGAGAIKKLSIEGVRLFDLPRLCARLKTNRTLEELRTDSIRDRAGVALLEEVLEHSKTTLKVVELKTNRHDWHPPLKCGKIVHLTRLNAFGRHQASSPTATKDDILPLLRRVAETKDLKVWQKVDLYFHLLLSSVAAWTGSPPLAYAPCQWLFPKPQRRRIHRRRRRRRRYG